jgi:two-component system sensor histidine kinase BaeS
MGRRLAVAFALVALLAVGVLGAVTWIETRSQVSDLVRSRNTTTGREVAGALGDAYQAAGSWQQADPHSAMMLAATSGASLTVLDLSGQTVSGGVGPNGLGRGRFGRGGRGQGMMGRGVAASGPLGSPQQFAVTASGERVGTAVLRFPQATPAPEQQVRSALGRTVLWGGALAAALAAAIGLLVAGRITRPLRRLTRAARLVAAGDRGARAGGGGEPAELGELGVAFDRMAATIEREDALRRAFAADVAHELRTPLAIAQGELEELVDGIAQPTVERLSSLHEEMLRLGRIVQDVETLAAAQAAQFRLERHRIDLAAIANDTVARRPPQAAAAGLRLTTQLAPTAIDVDRPRMEQVAHNLLANALKFTPAGGTVTVSVGSVNGDARLIVEDTGPGLSEVELAHIFERFWRGPSARDAAGSGVGLAVVAELVRAHGGHIEAANRPSGGARFTVTLPHA